MSHADFVFWSFLFFGGIILAKENRLSIISLIFSAVMMFVQLVSGADNFLSYVVRLAALFIFGAIAIKLRVFGAVTLFLFLLITSFFIYLTDVHYLIALVLLIAPVLIIVFEKCKGDLRRPSWFFSAVEWLERRLGEFYLTLLYAAMALPFLFIIGGISRKWA